MENLDEDFKAEIIENVSLKQIFKKIVKQTKT